MSIYFMTTSIRSFVTTSLGSTLFFPPVNFESSLVSIVLSLMFLVSLSLSHSLSLSLVWCLDRVPYFTVSIWSVYNFDRQVLLMSLSSIFSTSTPTSNFAYFKPWIMVYYKLTLSCYLTKFINLNFFANFEWQCAPFVAF